MGLILSIILCALAHEAACAKAPLFRTKSANLKHRTDFARCVAIIRCKWHLSECRSFAVSHQDIMDMHAAPMRARLVPMCSTRAKQLSSFAAWSHVPSIRGSLVHLTFACPLQQQRTAEGLKRQLPAVLNDVLQGNRWSQRLPVT